MFWCGFDDIYIWNLNQHKIFNPHIFLSAYFKNNYFSSGKPDESVTTPDGWFLPTLQPCLPQSTVRHEQPAELRQDLELPIRDDWWRQTTETAHPAVQHGRVFWVVPVYWVEHGRVCWVVPVCWKEDGRVFWGVYPCTG